MYQKCSKRCLSIVLLLFMVMFCSTNVYATQSHTENFDKTYSLGSNQAENLVNVAQKQIGKTKANLGYTEAWCADFVCDCAKLTGMPDNIIPYHYASRGACTYLYNYMVKNCSAKEVLSRQKGDIVFYYCSGCGRYVHTGIVLDGTYTIEGNYDGKVTKVKNSYTDSAGHKLSSGTIVRKYLRPNYSNITSPTPSGNNYYNSYGFDSPANNGTITEGSFLFQGWIDAKKNIASITCSINHGTHYIETNLYKRPDVPNATAFRIEVDSNLLNIGNNDVALCANFTDGSATVVENRTVTWAPKLLWGFDSPAEGMQISDNQFQFSGWIETGRKLDRITCSLNHGEQYFIANLYKRPDVPNATAFRLDIGSSHLRYGENYIAICAHYADGTGETIAEHKVNKCTIDAIEYPQNNEKFTCKNAWFLLQGWSTDDNRQIDHFEFRINDKSYTTLAHTRSDLSGNARYYRVEIPINRIENGKNEIEILACYTNGTSRGIGQVSVFGELDHIWDTGEITRIATCAESGTKTYICTNCNTTKTEEIPATGNHQNTEVRNVKEATCLEEGYTGDTYCKDCGTKLSSGMSIAKKEHTWNAGKITKAATCKESGTKTYTCTNCNTTKTEEIPATGNHQNMELRNEKVATCTEEGYTGDTYCKDCGTKLSSGTMIAKTIHTWDAGKITKAATCTESGTKTYTCTNCNTTKTEEIPATGNHQNTELRNVREATCTEEGYTGDTYCKDCGTKLSSGKTVSKKDHTWDIGKITKVATCKESGTQTYTCTSCNTTRTEEIPATGNHQNTEVRNVKEATCLEEGYTGDTYCKDCGTKLSSGKTVSKKDHTWDSGKILKAATCKEAGIKTYTCTSCNTTRSEEIPATGNHQNTELRNVKEATCAQEGYTGDTYCKDCGEKLSSGKTIAKTDHIWDSGRITKPATDTESGIKTYTCINCNTTRTEEIPATGEHLNTELRGAKSATCLEEGYTGDTYCKDCGTKLSSGTVIPKTGHIWDEGVVTKATTCTEKGIRTYTCSVCESTKIEEIPSTGHGTKITKFAKEATYTQEGYTGDIYCQDCGTLLEEGKVLAKLEQPKTKVMPGEMIGDKASNGVYKVLADGRSVEFVRQMVQSKAVKIPDTVSINGTVYTVTGISANAFKNNQLLRTAVIGRNVRRIGKQAFYNCKNLRTITIRTSMLTKKNIGTKAFKGTYKKIKVKVPAKQFKTYKKFFKSKGMSTKAIYKK